MSYFVLPQLLRLHEVLQPRLACVAVASRGRACVSAHFRTNPVDQVGRANLVGISLLFDRKLDYTVSPAPQVTIHLSHSNSAQFAYQTLIGISNSGTCFKTLAHIVGKIT
jgi:hypothetical protein